MDEEERRKRWAVAKEVAKLYPTLKWSDYIPILPTPKQAAFLQTTERECFYGGAAGGGKTVALLAAALQYTDIKDYSALILRASYGDLSGSHGLMDLAQMWLSDTDAEWQGYAKRWKFPTGAALSFGYLEESKSIQDKYQGLEYQYVALDELTQFQEFVYTFFFERLRRAAGSTIPLRLRAASNPGNIGHDWVKARFISTPHNDRKYIPAVMAENPYLDVVEYRKSLGEIDAVRNAQLERGDWDVRNEGGMFKRENFKLIDVIPEGCRWVRYWDMAATEKKEGKDPDWTVGVRMGLKDGRYYIVDVIRRRLDPAGTEGLVKHMAELDGHGISIVMEEEGGSSGKAIIDHYARHVLAGYAFKGIRSTGTKEARATPFSTAVSNGNVFILKTGWNYEFINELEAFPRGAHDDQVDASSGAFNALHSSTGTAVMPMLGGELVW